MWFLDIHCWPARWPSQCDKEKTVRRHLKSGKIEYYQKDNLSIQDIGTHHASPSYCPFPSSYPPIFTNSLQILSIWARAYKEDKEATTRQHQIQRLDPASWFSTRKLDMITIPDKNSWSEHPNTEFRWMPVTREEDHGNVISRLHSVPKIINSPKSVARGDKKFDAWFTRTFCSLS